MVILANFVAWSCLLYKLRNIFCAASQKDSEEEEVDSEDSDGSASEDSEENEDEENGDSSGTKALWF